MMKKILVVFLCLCMTVITFAACGERGGGGGDEGSAAGGEASYELVIGHVYTEDSLEHQQMLFLKDAIEEKTDGAVKVTIYANEQLGDEQTIAESVVAGSCDVGFSEGSVWATVVNKPEVAVFGLPFQLSGPDAAKEVTKELIKPEMNKLLEGTDIYCLGNVYSGFRHMLSVNKPIKTLEDLKGLKFRVPNATIYVQMFEDMGANPTTTAFSETYQALQQGVVEACECDLANIVQQNWHEVNHYMAKTYHLCANNVICINRAKWESFPEDIQDAILEAVEESEDYCFEIRATADDEYIGAIEDAGVEIYEVPAEELARMKEACQPIYDEFEGYGLTDLLKKIDDISAKYQ